MKRRLFALTLVLTLLLSACSSGKTAQETAGPQAASPAEAAAETREPQKSAEPVIDAETGKKKLILAGIRLSDYGWDFLAE